VGAPVTAPLSKQTEQIAAGRPAAMRFIMLTVLLDMVAVGLIIPVLPVLIGQFEPDKAEQAFWNGAAMASFGLANFIFSPVLGALSDRFGRRPVLLLGFCGFALSFFGTALATSLWMLLAVRVASGALQANVAVANAYVADITAPQDRAKRFGMLGAMLGLGFVLGPVLGGWLGLYDVRWPFFVAGTLSLLNLAYGYFVLPESLPVERRRAISWRTANPIASLIHLSQLKAVGGLVAVIALSNLAQFVLHSTWVLHTTFRFGWTTAQNGWSLFVVGVVSVVVQGFLMQRLLSRLGAALLATWGLVSGTCAYLLWGLAQQGWMMYAVIAVNLLGVTVGPALQSIVSSAADPKTQGQAMGAVASLASLMTAIAPLLGAGLLGAVAHLPPSDWRVGAPYFFCSALMVLCTALAVAHFKRQNAAQLASPATGATH
jgi:MFS transporter, DHA1 family, tetracycline resistance protein